MPAQNWRSLYRTAAACALLVLLTIPLQVVIFAVSPPPETVLDWFTKFNETPALGLLSLDLLYIATQVLLVPVLLALYIALRENDPALPLIALAVGAFGIAVHTTSNPSLDMLFASRGYATAATDAERAAFVAVGELLLIRWVGTAYTLGYIIGALAILLMSWVMWRSETFSRLCAGSGMAVGVLWLVPPSFGTVGLIFAFLSLLPTMLWLGLLVRHFSQMSR